MAKFELFPYNPSGPAAVIFIILFGITTFFHIYQLARTRTWYLIPLSIGAAMECGGYVGRFIASRQTPDWTLGPFIEQTLLILIAPALCAASIYMILGRIIVTLEANELSMIRPSLLTKIFVIGDVLSFLILTFGGSTQTSHDITVVKRGQKIMLIGLFTQIIFFGLFIVVSLRFHQQIHKNPTNRSMTSNVQWQKHMFVLYGASGLIMLRSISRVVEYMQGFGGYIMSHEVLLYVFDAAPMLLAIALFNAVHPSEVVPGKGGSLGRGKESQQNLVEESGIRMTSRSLEPHRTGYVRQSSADPSR